MREFIEGKNHLIKNKKEFYSSFIKHWVSVTGKQVDINTMELYIKRSQKGKR